MAILSENFKGALIDAAVLAALIGVPTVAFLGAVYYYGNQAHSKGAEPKELKVQQDDASDSVRPLPFIPPAAFR